MLFINIIFLLFVKVTSQDVHEDLFRNCNHHLYPLPGKLETIKDVNYPNGFTKGACKWTVTCHRNYYCYLRCHDVQLQYSWGCLKDRILVSKTGSSLSNVTGGYCYSKPFQVRSEKQLIVLALIANEKSNGRLSCEVEALPLPKEKQTRASEFKEILIAMTGNCSFIAKVHFPDTKPAYPPSRYMPCSYRNVLNCEDWDSDCLGSCETEVLPFQNNSKTVCSSPGSFDCKVVNATETEWVIESAFLPYGFGVVERKSNTNCFKKADRPMCGFTNHDVTSTNNGPLDGVLNIYPMMAAIVNQENKKTQLLCEGTIIDKYHVLTTANCSITNVYTVRVVVGQFQSEKDDNQFQWHVIESTANVYLVQRFIKHDKFVPSDRSPYNDYDIALVRVQDAMVFGYKVAPACLPYKYIGQDIVGYNVSLLGYNYDLQTSHKIYKLDFEVVSRGTCDFKNGVKNDTSKQLCTVPRVYASREVIGAGIYLKDRRSGRFFVVGIASAKIYNPLSEYYNFNIAVQSTLDWIDEKTSTGFLYI